MSLPPSPTPSGPSGFPTLDVLLDSAMGAAGALIVGLIGLFGVLFSQRAPLQVALNGAFSALTKELQDERAQLIARIFELETQLGQAQLKILERDGEIRGLKQLRDSLQRSTLNSTEPEP